MSDKTLSTDGLLAELAALCGPTAQGRVQALLEQFDERAGVYEFDGGLDRHHAEALALAELRRESCPTPSPPAN